MEYDLYDGWAQFCNHVESGCPWSEGTQGTFHYTYNITNGYQAVGIDTNFYIVDPSETTRIIGCVEVKFSPVLAASVYYPICFGVLAVLVLLAIAHYAACRFNPWSGTSNIYFSSTNYEYDTEAIRLSTPGISDFLYYVQFAFLTGCLTLDYPAFLQPILSSVSWSSLMFHFSWVSKIYQHFNDNLYLVNGHYGMSRMGRVVQAAKDGDIWPGFIVWLIVACAAILICCTLRVYGKKILSKGKRASAHTSTDSSTIALNMDQGHHYDHNDYKAKAPSNPMGLSVPGQDPLRFLIGRFIFIILKLFALPLLTLGFFQLYIIGRFGSTVESAVFSVISILIWISLACSGFILTTIYAFHQLGELKFKLVWGALYNTFPISQRPIFIGVDLLVKLIQGFAIGIVQRSGLAQLIILIILEVIYFFGIVICHPFETGTSMNLVSALLCVVRLVTLCLMMPFVFEVNTSEATKGWLGYTLLVVHGVVVLLFLAHAIQVYVELILRRDKILLNTNPSPIVPALKNAEASRPSYELKRLTLVDDEGDRLADDTRYRRSYYRNSRDPGLNPPREGIFEEVFASSPISDLQSPTSTAKGSSGYYRRPRRRQSSHDWGMTDPGSASIQSSKHHRKYKSDEKTLISDEEDFDFNDKESNKVDYAVREADMYITKRGSSASWFTDELDSSHPSMGFSRDPTMYEQQHNEDLFLDQTNEEKLAGGTVGRFFGKFKGLAGNAVKDKSKDPVDPGPSGGFEVLSRRKIVPVVTETVAAVQGAAVGTSAQYDANEKSDVGLFQRPPAARTYMNRANLSVRTNGLDRKLTRSFMSTAESEYESARSSIDET